MLNTFNAVVINFTCLLCSLVFQPFLALTFSEIFFARAFFASSGMFLKRSLCFLHFLLQYFEPLATLEAISSYSLLHVIQVSIVLERVRKYFCCNSVPLLMPSNDFILKFSFAYSWEVTICAGKANGEVAQSPPLQNSVKIVAICF